MLEIGVGTGAVALLLSQSGHPVVGIDLSLPMLLRAKARLGARLAIADGYLLPHPAAVAPNVVIVWVLQLVPGVAGFLAEAARVLTPGGRLVVVPAGGQFDPDDIGAVVRPMGDALRPPPDRPEHVVAAGRSAGLDLVAQLTTQTESWFTSPEEQAQRIETRTWSSLWDVADDTWAALVQPAIDALRALPEPDRKRERRTHYEIVVLERR